MLVLLLITGLGLVITQYSQRYLQGELKQRRYVVNLLITLAAVTLVASTQHFGVLLIAWSVSSFSLHGLLTFYPQRPAAQLAAHKKFIASRVAEVLLLAALGLLWFEAGTLSLDGLFSAATTMSASTLNLAMGLVALAVIFKSAQLPVHGWLIQVMEAPTPVSALLHAGVVNMGGWTLIRLAPLLEHSALAQWLLIVVGLLTAALAGVVMLTRISIKVRLAWSTCAQMGFMLLECGLGLYDLALLHLLAHSIYKAYAFLSAGDTVQRTQLQQRLGALSPPTLTAVLWAAPLSWLLCVMTQYGAVIALRPLFELQPTSWLTMLVLALALAPLLWRWLSASGLYNSSANSYMNFGLRMLGLHIAVNLLSVAWHALFAPAVSGIAADSSGSYSISQGLSVASGFCILYVVECWLLSRPHSWLSQRLYPWAFAGFHCDELFTRLTFLLWPPRPVADTELRIPTSHSLSKGIAS